ncbi:hypothetical protein JOB18_026959 [Solea senegalensis]|uniref:Uncharacterized protein n=1 Tax=Solea senegalensis TaxID=28829 RepID=A0AAV6Q4Z7_SOLSE|nr:hypothetical protein JOB18_026959 [Solea senegalensis]
MTTVGRRRRRKGREGGRDGAGRREKETGASERGGKKRRGEPSEEVRVTGRFVGQTALRSAERRNKSKD